MSITLPVAEQPGEETFFQEYALLPGVYDEMFAAPGVVRPHWKKLVDRLQAIGRQELGRRWEQAHRVARENGVTFSAYGETGDAARPWDLDAVPIVLAHDEWRNISVALEQRARLLNLILADLYGPRSLLSRGLLPAEIVFGHPGFRPAYYGQKVPDECYLHMYAADLARSPDGQWWVVGDRTKAPSGTGYALENRIVTSRILPAIFKECRVERLASYFIELQETLKRLAPRYRDNPRIVLLSQGPGSGSYFEDAYLARYLGYTLVEGGDLAVRENRVHLKTLGGLLPVEVILRRVDDEDCDPLELRADSIQGVAGLLEAVRAGNVVVANSLGSELVESPVFMSFLPALCRELLGEELKLPSVATWWCGDEKSRAHVLEHLDRLVVRPAFRRHLAASSSRDGFGDSTREHLVEMIQRRPHDFVAQERVTRSTTPVWTNSQLQPWRVALRAFLVASRGAYTTMPGGLVRVAPSPDALDQTMSAGERSQDAWVLSVAPVKEVTLLQPAGQSVPLRRSGAELPSRVADNLFWLGRVIERAEGLTRYLRGVFVRLTSELGIDGIPELPMLLRGLAEQGQIEPGFAIEGFSKPLPAIEQVLPFAVFDPAEPMSLRSTVSQVHRLASIVRDRLSIDSWRIIHRIDQDFQLPVNRGLAPDPFEVLARLDTLVIDLSAFSGLVAESMTRTQGWRFLDIGRRLERALQTVNLLQIAVVEPEDNEPAILQALLEIADSLMTYRSRYLANLQLRPVLDLLLTDESNPRSVAYQLVALAGHVDNLPREPLQAVLGPEQRIAMSILNSVRLADIESLGQMQSDGVRKHLDRLLLRLSDQLPKLSDTISHKYLIHAGPHRQMADLRTEFGP